MVHGPFAGNSMEYANQRRDIDAAVGNASERVDADCALLQRLSVAGGNLLSFAWRPGR